MLDANGNQMLDDGVAAYLPAFPGRRIKHVFAAIGDEVVAFYRQKASELHDEGFNVLQPVDNPSASDITEMMGQIVADFAAVGREAPTPIDLSDPKWMLDDTVFYDAFIYPIIHEGFPQVGRHRSNGSDLDYPQPGDVLWAMQVYKMHVYCETRSVMAALRLIKLGAHGGHPPGQANHHIE